ncbi:SDR family NAD(P)-dependent oxidoreductase [Methylobacterium sp. A49B]
MIYASDLFENRTVVVTGGGSGIGQAVAQQIADRGGRIILVGRNQARLEEARSSLRANDHRIVQCDLSDFESTAETLAGEALTVQGFDGVFHAAGAELVQATRMTKSKHVQDILGGALFGAIGIAKAVCKTGVMKSPGSVVMMSSVAAHRGKAGMALYSAAKAGVEGLTRSLAAELAAKSIRVNALAAGAIETPMHERIVRSMSEDAKSKYQASHPLGFGRTDDVASAAIYLLSDASRWVTATVHIVDGGYSGV